MDKFTSSIDTITLEKVKLAAHARLSAQLLHDTRIEAYQDRMLNQMVYQLSTYVYGMKNEHRTQSVPYERTVERTKYVTGTVEQPRKAGLAVFAVACIVGMAALMFSAIVSFIALGAALGALLSAMDARRIPYAVYVNFHETVYGEVEIDAESWTMFPENEIVFPKGLGRAVTTVRYSQPRYFPEGD